jgi:hypothetical protein
MTGRTKGGAQRACTLKVQVRLGGSPITATPIYQPITLCALILNILHASTVHLQEALHYILNSRHEYGPMHNTTELLKQINKTKFLIPYEQLYIRSHHHHKKLIPEQNSGEYNQIYQLVYEQQVMPHPTEPPDL